jgi:hypothetical protein
VTAPREVLPGRSYLLTRRCTQRQFLLKPSRRTNQLVRYCLGVAAAKTGLLLHAVCFMSNHWHGVVSDPLARLPEFLEHFHRLLAKAQNASLGRWENLWSSDKTSVVLLVFDEDVLEKMAYTIANPTAAGLVRSPREWPGVITTPSRAFRVAQQRAHCDSGCIGERYSVDMPDVFFDPEGTLPETVKLELTRPPIYPQLDQAQLARHLATPSNGASAKPALHRLDKAENSSAPKQCSNSPSTPPPKPPSRAATRIRASPPPTRPSAFRQSETSSHSSTTIAPLDTPGATATATKSSPRAPTRSEFTPASPVRRLARRSRAP